MSKTKISWCDEVWNPVVGCTAACSYCYARELHDRRYLAWRKGWDTAPVQYHHSFDKIQLFPVRLDVPLKRKKPTVFFVNSVSDLFDPAVPDSFIDRIYAVMALCPQHTFLILTKRAERLAAYWSAERTELGLRWWKAGQHPRELRRVAAVDCGRYPETGFPNVFHGVTAENQQTANESIPHLLRVPGQRFLSIEPMLGPVNLSCYPYAPDVFVGAIHAVLLGGESGPNARPLHPGWATSVRDQCAAAGVPFFFKQWGEFVHKAQVETWVPPADKKKAHFLDACCIVWRVGKKKAGRTLDGAIHNNLPWDQQGESK